MIAVYGSSDDRIEFDGDFYEELNEYNADGFVVLSNGVILDVRYGHDWSFRVVSGADFVKIEPANSESEDRTRFDVPEYSDLVLVDSQADWVFYVPREEAVTSSR